MNMESRRPSVGSGSLKVDPAGRLGESNPNVTTAQRLDAIDLFCPAASDDERGLRKRIHKAQGAANSAATQSDHCRARSIFWTAAQMAGDWQFRPATAEDLAEVINGLSYLFLAARLVERTEAPDAG